MLSGQTVLVTGGSKGIGLAIARLACRASAAGVALLARGAESLAAAQEDLTTEFPSTTVSVHAADVTAEGEVEEAFAAAVATHGAIDVLVNNAGIMGKRLPLVESESAELARVMDVNVMGAYHVLMAGLRSTPRPRVVINMSSAAGVRGIPELGLYCASKFALNGLSATAGEEFPDVRIIAISPGSVATDLNPQGERDPEDIGPFFDLLVDPARSEEYARFQESVGFANGGYAHVSDFEAFISSSAPSSE